MTDLPNYTLQRILNSAKKEFLAKGYQEASLRDISKEASVTTGALYGYFKNKEDLFGAIVHCYYYGIQQKYRDVLNEFLKLPTQTKREAYDALSTAYMMSLANYMYEHYDEFKLILCCSEDTKYSDLVNEMALIDERATKEYLESLASSGIAVEHISPRLEHILTTGLFSMFFELIVHDIPQEDAHEYVHKLMEFFSTGYRKILGL